MENVRGMRANIMWILIEECGSYKWLFENIPQFRKYKYRAVNSNKKRVRNKYMNKIIKEMRWLEKQIKKYS